jgi:hypothetical protein
MDSIFSDHVNRLRTAVLKKHTAASIAAWITENTTYAGQPYSYMDHEFQERVLSDTSRDVVVIKCSQVGISEVAARMALALVNVLRPYKIAYTLPTANLAALFTKTRIDPVITGSKTMASNIHRANNNSDVKQFGESFLYMRGAVTAPISLPIDHNIHDEVDYSDQEVLGQYNSRLTHSKWRRTTKFSTPTVPNFGIHLAFQETRQFFNLCKCDHCNHYFQPDYYKHVKIPGYLGNLEDINKQTLPRIRFQEAAVICPACGKQPSLQHQHREWVQANPDAMYLAAGYQITPFDAPNIIQVPYLVEASTKYDRIQDFVNANLGLAAEDSEATLLRTDFDNMFVRAEAGDAVQYVMGIDVGNTYHFVIDAVDAWGDTFTVHTERVAMGNARKRYSELRAQWRISCTVIDSMPHAETVMALQDTDPNLYASVYTVSKGVQTHNVIEKTEERDLGKEFVRQVNVNRSRALDGYMEYLRGGHKVIRDSEEKEDIIKHHMSMKRVKVYDLESGEMNYSWQKSDGNDHYHHAFLYAWIAGKIRGIGKSLVVLPTFGMFSFRNKTL